jgi:hypothetical protein
VSDSPGDLHRKLAELHDRKADLLEELAKVEEEIFGLQQRLLSTGGTQRGNTGDVVTTANVRVSLRAVAEAVGVSHALLSKARAGQRKIRRSLAERIAELTPTLPATKKTWPLGWVDE